MVGYSSPGLSRSHPHHHDNRVRQSSGGISTSSDTSRTAAGSPSSLSSPHHKSKSQNFNSQNFTSQKFSPTQYIASSSPQQATKPKSPLSSGGSKKASAQQRRRVAGGGNSPQQQHHHQTPSPRPLIQRQKNSSPRPLLHFQQQLPSTTTTSTSAPRPIPGNPTARNRNNSSSSASNMSTSSSSTSSPRNSPTASYYPHHRSGSGSPPARNSPTSFAASMCYQAPTPSSLPLPPMQWTTCRAGAGPLVMAGQVGNSPIDSSSQLKLLLNVQA